MCGFYKTEKSRYLENETFFQIKKNHLLHVKGYFIAKNSFVTEETFNFFTRKQLTCEFWDENVKRNQKLNQKFRKKLIFLAINYYAPNTEKAE